MTQDTWACTCEVPLPPSDSPDRAKKQRKAGLFHSTQVHTLVPLPFQCWAGKNSHYLQKAIEIKEPGLTDDLPNISTPPWPVSSHVSWDHTGMQLIIKNTI